VKRAHKNYTSIEVCAGAGGQALGLENAGFDHVELVEYEFWPCETMQLNRPHWDVIEGDLREYSYEGDEDVDLLAGGVPCPPFSVAGKQLGPDDERDLFPEMLRLTEELQPRAVMIENVRGLLDASFDPYRKSIHSRLADLGYESDIRLLNARDFGVPQLRPRAVIVAMRSGEWQYFEWPDDNDKIEAPTVGETLHKEMASEGWEGADMWRETANSIAPTLVGGSRKHGGPDLGPTRARAAWAKLGVNGKLLAKEPPQKGFEGDPCLTVKMAALLQGFPPEWEFAGPKTHSYRQVGNAFPPPVAEAVGNEIRMALELADAARIKTRKRKDSAA
jgi:DNA (cytosine-5)-methyltransferase 1